MEEEHIDILTIKIKGKFREYAGKINTSGLEDSVIQTIKGYLKKHELEIVKKDK